VNQAENKSDDDPDDRQCQRQAADYERSHEIEV
jgi:hypothetical protein